MRVFSIADAPPSVDFFSVDDWREIVANNDPVHEGMVLAKAEKALALQLDQLNAPVIWGFHKADLVPNSISVLQDVSEFKLLKGIQQREASQRKFFCSWFSVLRDHALQDLDLDYLLGLVLETDSSFDLEQDNLNVLCREIAVNYRGKWVQFDKAVFFLIMKNQDTETRSADSVRNGEFLLRTLYDATVLKNQVKQNVPWSKMAQLVANEPEKWENIFYGPRQFHPFEPTQKDRFIWPWQRCMEGVGKGAERRLKLRGIPTTSIVADLRHSTKAMGLFAPPERYAELLDEIVTLCRRRARNSGAYFDKETGDGFVAHFCTSPIESDGSFSDDLSREIELASNLAREIILEAGDVCRKFAPSLKHGIGALQLSVGIHSEEAVWLCDRERIRAVGPSVVWAARLCSCAGPGEVIISNYSYEALSKGGVPRVMAEFSRRKVKFKEYNDTTQLYGYSMKLWRGDDE